MNNAEVIKASSGNREQLNEFVTFKSNDSPVFAITGGKVNMIAKIDHMKVVIIEKDKLFYTYSNLGSTLIKKGDYVKADQLIGYATFDLDGYKPSIEFYMSNAEKNIQLNPGDFIKRQDKKLTDHSIELNLQEPD